MRLKYDILDISPFIIFHNYDPAIPWDVENDASKRETPVTKERVKEI